MKTIRKITNKVTNNISGLAGSALLVGATLTGGAAFAAAQDSGSSGSSMDLGDYPAPFVDEDGNVETSIVLGSDAQVTDVVGATEIAGSLGAAAFGEEEVQASGNSEGTWSATNGVTLDTSNTKVHMGDNINVAKNTLTNDDLNLLTTNEVLTGDAEQDVEQYLKLGTEPVNYDASPSELDDPTTYVEVPAENSVDSGTYLYQLQANFQDGVSFSDDSDNNKNEDVYGEDVRMFGQQYSVAEDSFTGDGQLILYGSTDTEDVEAGGSVTLTIDDEEVSVELIGINEDGEAVLTVAGSQEYLEEDDSVTVNGEELRVTKVNNYDPQDSISDNVELSVGSSQVTLEHDQPVMTGSDDEEVDGTHVTLKGSGVTSSSADVTDGDTVDLSTVQVSVGAADSDNNYLEADSTFEDPAFGTELQFAGLNPDAMENGEEIEVMADGDNDAVVDFTTTNGESANINFAHDEDVESGGTGPELKDDSDQAIHVEEGTDVAKEEYTVIESGDFSRMVQVTDFDADNKGSDDGNEEITVTYEDVVTGSEFETTIDEGDDDGDWDSDSSDTEVIDGQTYTLTIPSGVTMDSGSETVQFDDGNSEVDVYNGLETGNEATIHPVGVAYDNSVATVKDSSSTTWEVPNGFIKIQNQGSSSDTIVSTTTSDTPTTFSQATTFSSTDGDTDDQTVDVGSVTYEFDIDVGTGGQGGDPDEVKNVHLDASDASPAVLVLEEEGDDGTQDNYIVSAATDESDDERVELGSAASGADDGTATFTANDASLVGHDDNDISSDISSYGTYVEEDSGDAGEYSFMYPAGQSTAGLAVTEEDGSVSPGGGSGTVNADMATYQYGDGVLADDGNVDQVKNNDNTILVGGPAANSLTQELVTENMTMPAEDYTQGQGMIQLTDGFPGGHALVVAGATGEDTREAAEFLADYRNNGDALEGQSQVTIETQSGTVVE